MIETDPFADSAFLGRLNKLLPMLGSAQPGEADAARRKIAEHLAQHRLSFTDLALRLGESGSTNGHGPSFLGGARELGLERQLAIARAAKEEATAEAALASARVHALEVELQRATFEIGRTLRGQARLRNVAAIAWCVAASGVALAIVSQSVTLGWRSGPPTKPVSQGDNVRLNAEDLSRQTATLHAGPGERAGTAAVQDLPIRLGPSDDAAVRAFLNQGERLVIQQETHVGSQTWLLVRTATGSGWVRAGDVLH